MNFDSMSRASLRKLAQTRNIAARSKMTTEELREAVRVAVQCAPSPLTNAARASNYMNQNGSNKLTARQARRVRHNTFTAASSI